MEDNLNLVTITKVKILGKEYEISYPNIGQQLAIENKKFIFSDGLYSDMVKNANHMTAINLLNLIDAGSYFSVLSEEISKDFGLQEFSKLNMKNQVLLRDAFTTQFWPWYSELESKIYDSM